MLQSIDQSAAISKNARTAVGARLVAGQASRQKVADPGEFGFKITQILDVLAKQTVRNRPENVGNILDHWGIFTYRRPNSDLEITTNLLNRLSQVIRQVVGLDLAGSRLVDDGSNRLSDQWPGQSRRVSIVSERKLKNRAKFKIYHSGGSQEEVELPAVTKTYFDLEDFISSSKLEVLRADIMREKDRLHIVLITPTFNSADYLQPSLDAIKGRIDEVLAKHPNWEVEWVLALNGFDQGIALGVLLDYQKSHASLKMTILHLDGILGKPNAMNAGAVYAKAQAAHVLGFIDDDVRYSPNALVTSLDFLVENPGVYLTGPRAEPIRRFDPHDLFSIFESHVESVSSLPAGSGQFMLAETYPMIPAEVIIDDEFLNMYFLRRRTDLDLLPRVCLAPGAVASFGLTGDYTSYLKRYRRLVMGHRQFQEIFKDENEKILQRRWISTSRLSHKVFIGKRFEGLSWTERLRMFFLIVGLQIAKSWIEFSRMPRFFLEGG